MGVDVNSLTYRIKIFHFNINAFLKNLCTVYFKIYNSTLLVIRLCNKRNIIESFDRT